MTTQIRVEGYYTTVKSLSKNRDFSSLCFPVLKLSVAFCLLVAILQPQQAAGQLFPVRSILDSPFDARETALGIQPHLLHPFRSAPYNGGNTLAVGYTNSNTARTVQNGAPVGDLFGDGYSLSATFGQGRKVMGQFLWENSVQHGLLVGSDQKRTTADLTAESWAGRVTVRAGAGQIYLGYGKETTRVNARSDLLANALPLFTTNPDAAWHWTRHEIALGALWPITRQVGLEAAVAWEDAPSEITLTDNAARLNIPMDGTGSALNLCLRARLDRSMQFFAFAQRTDIAGQGIARRDGSITLGNTQTSYGSKGWGIGLRRTFGGTGTVSLTFSLADTHLDSHAYALNPIPLGFDPGRADRVGYFLFETFTRRTYGARWEQRFSRNRALDFDYRWIELPFRVEYGYTAASFLVGISQSGTWNIPDARGHLVSLRYTFPARPVTITLGLSQIIPMPVSRGKPPSGPPSAPRRASGGWSLNLTLRYQLR